MTAETGAVCMKDKIGGYIFTKKIKRQFQQHSSVVDAPGWDKANSAAVSRPIGSVKASDVGFEDYAHKKTFSIDKTVHRKVLITGVGSYIGEAFQQYCGIHYPNIETAAVDMADGRWREKSFEGFDTVFHVAGLAHADVGRAAPAEQERYYSVNTDLAEEAAEKTRGAGVKQFIFMSSMIIYGQQGKDGIDEYTLPKPENFYGNSKWLADLGVRRLGDSGFHVAVIRAPMVYGKGSRGNYPQLSKLAERSPCFPDISNRRSMLYIENLCEFVSQLVLSGEGGIYFPQNSTYSNTSELVRLIRECHHKKTCLSKGLSLAAVLAGHIPGKVKGLAGKAFGDSWYAQGLSRYQGLDYQKISLEESIRLTEG